MHEIGKPKTYVNTEARTDESKIDTETNRTPDFGDTKRGNDNTDRGVAGQVIVVITRTVMDCGRSEWRSRMRGTRLLCTPGGYVSTAATQNRVAATCLVFTGNVSSK